METLSIPVFPLHTVLFPGGPLPLRVFETRYLDMVSGCLKDDSPMGICLIREGSEVGKAASIYDVGTLARITYWNRRPDGLLGVTVTGGRRFRILDREVQPDQLIRASVELLPEEAAQSVPQHLLHLATMLQDIMGQLDHPYIHLPKHYGDAAWVGGRLAELLPIRLAAKQSLLQLDDPLDRLERLNSMLEAGELS